MFQNQLPQKLHGLGMICVCFKINYSKNCMVYGWCVYVSKSITPKIAWFRDDVCMFQNQILQKLHDLETKNHPFWRLVPNF